MRFNTHSRLRDQHAFLSASNYHWINYSEQKLEARWQSHRSAAIGTAKHAYAHMAIQLGIMQADTGQTINSYINDAILFRMESEQILFYSDNAFGTADTISFRDGFLRIHDLKTGISQTSFLQLAVYAAFFCLEYGHKPFDLKGIEFRIYQNDEVKIEVGDPNLITMIMDRTVTFDRIITERKKEEFL